MGTRRYLAQLTLVASIALITSASSASSAPSAHAQSAPPPLTGPVNDFAGMIDSASSADLDRQIRALKAASGDVIVVATLPSHEGYLDIRELAVKLFENGGRGIGDKGKDNGLLVVVAAKERRVAIEVGYDLEGIVTDGFAGETIRETILPAFRAGEYGRGLVAAVARLSARIAAARGLTLEGVPQRQPERQTRRFPPLLVPFLIFLLFVLINNWAGRGRRRNRWRGGPWSGWSGGVGPFGGGSFGGGFGGFGGGGFGGGSGGGGFGGFGGGRSGGGGAAGGW